MAIDSLLYNIEGIYGHLNKVCGMKYIESILINIKKVDQNNSIIKIYSIDWFHLHGY